MTIECYTDTVVLIPALNEEASIGQTIRDVKEHVPGCRIIVINGPSTDNTTGIALRYGADVIDAPIGKGRAVRTRLPTILSLYPKSKFVMLDGDYTYPAKHIPEIVDRLTKGADVVIGYRERKADGSMTRINQIGNRGLSVLASLLYGGKVKDVCSGMWGFRGSVLAQFDIISNEFTLEADFFVNAVKGACRIEQIPIEYRARIGGSKPKLKVADGFKIGLFLLKRTL